jgi:hypothetical protein
MNVPVNKKEFRDFLRAVLFEQSGGKIGSRVTAPLGKESMAGADSHATYDITAGTMGDDTTVPDEVPVEPSEMMSQQLATERPPVEDPDFKPANPDELSKAAEVLSKVVPDGQIEDYYNSLKDLVNAAVEKENDPELADIAGASEKMPVEADEERQAVTGVGMEEVRRSLSAWVIKELKESRWEDETDLYGNEYDESSGYSIESFDEPAPNADTGPEGASFEELAPMMGKSGASGARQELERILKRLQFIAGTQKMTDINKLKSAAREEFITALRDGDFLDDDDVVELEQAPGEVEQLDSFRFFFVSAFITPAYKEIKKQARKAAEQEISKLKIPKKSFQTILNQALGETPKNPGKLANKIAKDAAAEGMKEEEIPKIIKGVQDAFSKIEKAAIPSGDLSSLAVEKWRSAGKAKRVKVLDQALQSTAEFQEEFGAE